MRTFTLEARNSPPGTTTWQAIVYYQNGGYISNAVPPGSLSTFSFDQLPDPLDASKAAAAFLDANYQIVGYYEVGPMTFRGGKNYICDYQAKTIAEPVEVPPVEVPAGFPWGKVALGTGVLLALMAIVRRGKKQR